MRIVDRYISNSIIKIFFTTMICFSLLFVIIDMASNLDELIDRKIPFEIVVMYYLARLPLILTQTSSIGCLIAVLFTFSHLNNNNEVIALRASGLNFWQITKPAICIGLIIAACVFLANEKYLPKAENIAKQIKNDYFTLEGDGKRKKQAKIKSLTFYGLKNRLYYIDSFDPNTYDINRITIIGYDDNQNIKEKIVALEGKWTGVAWMFYQCQIQTPIEGEEAFNAPTKIKVYEEKIMDIKETPEDFLKQRLNVTSMNIEELADYIRRFASSGAEKALNNFRVDLHQKIAFPFGHIVIILTGLPFALMISRRKAITFTSLGIAIAIGFLYYVINAVGLAFGKGGLFPPMLSAWLAPLIFTFLAGYLIKVKF